VRNWAWWLGKAGLGPDKTRLGRPDKTGLGGQYESGLGGPVRN